MPQPRNPSCNERVEVEQPVGQVDTAARARCVTAGEDEVLILVADVQAWADDPSSNFGWLLASESESSIAQKSVDLSPSPEMFGKR